MTTTATAAPQTAAPNEAATADWPLGEITRSIARGGLTGLIVGLVGCGIGSRLVMRLAALLVSGAKGSITENGNVIGVITADGTQFLLLGGTLVGLLAGTIWVVVSPWIPGSGLGRAILTIPIAIALGTAGLVDGHNPDFVVLRHDPAVIASLIALVGIIGFLFAIVDSWLERALPHPVRSRPPSASAGGYALLSFIGAVLIAPLVALAYFTSKDSLTVLMGIVIAVIAAATVTTWARRIRGREPRTRGVVLTGRLGLGAAVVLGYATIIPEVAQALGS
jgi:hypothetical protein